MGRLPPRHRRTLAHRREDGDRAPRHRKELSVPQIKLCSMNGEWMNTWFTPDAGPVGFAATFTLPGEQHVNNTQKTAKRAAKLIRAIDPDVLALQEAPSRIGELHL